MKKCVFIYILMFFNLISTFVFCEEITLTVTKIALKYKGESSYRIYDVPSTSIVINNKDINAAYGPTAVTTLTDESNGLIAGVITEIKYYATIQGEGSGWLTIGGAMYATPDNATNWLSSSGYELDLSTVKRKKITDRFYSDGNDLVVTSPLEENL